MRDKKPKFSPENAEEPLSGSYLRRRINHREVIWGVPIHSEAWLCRSLDATDKASFLGLAGDAFRSNEEDSVTLYDGSEVPVTNLSCKYQAVAPVT